MNMLSYVHVAFMWLYSTHCCSETTGVHGKRSWRPWRLFTKRYSASCGITTVLLHEWIYVGKQLLHAMCMAIHMGRQSMTAPNYKEDVMKKTYNMTGAMMPQHIEACKLQRARTGTEFTFQLSLAALVDAMCNLSVVNASVSLMTVNISSCATRLYVYAIALCDSLYLEESCAEISSCSNHRCLVQKIYTWV